MMSQDIKARITGHFVKICDYYLYQDIVLKIYNSENGILTSFKNKRT